MRNFLDKYFHEHKKLLSKFHKNVHNKTNLKKTVSILKATKKKNNSIYLIGNGGSSAIAEHMAIDLTKNAGLRAIAISGSPMLTTLSNDYGYEQVFQKALEFFARKGDILIAISSSGTSRNILNACNIAKEKKMRIITFSGFKRDNPLRNIGEINFWIGSCAFGHVELSHNLILHCINDAIIGSAEYVIR